MELRSPKPIFMSHLIANNCCTIHHRQGSFSLQDDCIVFTSPHGSKWVCNVDERIFSDFLNTKLGLPWIKGDRTSKLLSVFSPLFG